jgi:signal transduction histidine kinase
VYWTFSYSPVYGDGDRVAGVLVTCTETTEKVIIKKQLEESERKLRLSIMQAPLAIAIFRGPDYVTEIANTGALALWGRKEEEVLNKPILDAMPELKAQGIKQLLDDVYQTGNRFSAGELPVQILRDHTIETVYVNFSYEPLYNAFGQIDGIMTVGTDVTQQMLAHKNEIDTLKELEQQKDFFISMASHELKTPLTSIKGYVQILQSTYSTNQDNFLKNSLGIIDRQVSVLTKLIAELLDLSKIKAGALELSKERVDLNELTREIIDEIKVINPEHRIDFIFQWTGFVLADRQRISQVLINFLNNAIKYSPNSQLIGVTSVKDSGEVRITVQDFGIGINKTDQHRIFERFYRVEGINEKTFPGFGIGLFIASEIVQRHGGKIGVNSEPGKGSAFHFSLPLAVS